MVSDLLPVWEMNVILIARTRWAGRRAARTIGARVVAIVTPRDPHAARGWTADRIEIVGSMIRHPKLDELLADALPAMATRHGEVRWRR